MYGIRARLTPGFLLNQTNYYYILKFYTCNNIYIFIYNILFLLIFEYNIDLLLHATIKLSSKSYITL